MFFIPIATLFKLRKETTMRIKKPVLTLLHSDAVYDFSSVIGHKKELNEKMEKQIKDNEKRIAIGFKNAQKIQMK